MVILVNYKNNYDTETTKANKSMGFDLSATQSCGITYIYIFYYGLYPINITSFKDDSKDLSMIQRCFRSLQG